MHIQQGPGRGLSKAPPGAGLGREAAKIGDSRPYILKKNPKNHCGCIGDCFRSRGVAPADETSHGQEERLRHPGHDVAASASVHGPKRDPDRRGYECQPQTL